MCLTLQRMKPNHTMSRHRGRQQRRPVVEHLYVNTERSIECNVDTEKKTVIPMLMHALFV